MIYLTESERLKAIAICDKIEALNAKIQFHAAEAIRILDEMAGKASAKKDAQP